MNTKVTELEAYANAKLSEHGLSKKGWKFEWGKTKTSCGVCLYKKKAIRVSKCFIERTMDELKNTVLHEIAHALAGKENAHNSVWKDTAIKIGCNGERFANSKIKAHRKYKATCTACGKFSLHHRRRRISCGTCDNKFNANLLLQWSLNISPNPIEIDKDTGGADYLNQ